MDNPQAFPEHSIESRNTGEILVMHLTKGMTLRDYFAGQAMQAILSNPSLVPALANIIKSEGKIDSEIAQGAYTYADAMLAERNKK